jgi:hypothetical protein
MFTNKPKALEVDNKKLHELEAITKAENAK